jgi:hypothetical protein
MLITDHATQPSRVPGIPRKPLDNPQPTKPAYSSDTENASLLDHVLRRLPTHLNVRGGERFPLLAAVIRHDAWRQRDLARPLLFIAAATHSDADERHTAEYILRHRLDVVAHRRSARSLLSAARCAAEMEVRRIQRREAPASSESLDEQAVDPTVARVDDPSVGVAVVSYLHLVTGHLPATDLAHDRFLDAVAIAIELSQRHALNNGKGPSLIGMRPAARKDARLVTHLRAAFDDEVGARSLARMLVGSDGSPLETSLLWWAAQPSTSPASIPLSVRRRWVRDLGDIDPAIRGSETHRRMMRAIVPTFSTEVAELQLV